CHPSSHVNNDECGAPEFYTNGAKLVSVDGPSAKIDPPKLRRAANIKVGDVHVTQPSCVTITQATEVGSVYSIDEIREIGDLCRVPAAVIEGLLAAGFVFYHDRWEPGVVRFVTSFATTIDDVDHLIANVARLAAQ